MIILKIKATRKGYCSILMKPEDPEEALQVTEACGREEDIELEISEEVLFRRGLSPKTRIEYPVLKELIAEDEFVKAKETALKLLDRRMHTVQEVRDKLQEKGFSSPAVEKTLSTLTEYGLLNDRDFAVNYLKERIALRGKRALEQELLQKGIDHEVTGELLENLGEVEYEAALSSCRKKFESLRKRESDENKLREKVYRFLMSRGYHYELTKKVYNVILEERQNT